MDHRRMGLAEWALLFVLAILWGGSFFFVAIALRGLGPFTVVLGRVLLAAVALHIVARLFGWRIPWDARSWGAYAVMGILNNVVPFCLIVWGQTQIASGLAAILNATTPVFTIVVAHAFTRDEKLAVHKIAGVVVGLLGAMVVIGPGALVGVAWNALAQLAVLGAALSYAFAGVYGRRFRGQPPVVTAAGQLTVSTVLMLPLALIIEHPWLAPAPGPAAVGAIVALALLSSALAYVIYFRLLATAGATNLLLVTFLIPVTAVVLGALVLRERLALADFAGMGLIAAGLVAIDGRLLTCIRGFAKRNLTDTEYQI